MDRLIFSLLPHLPRAPRVAHKARDCLARLEGPRVQGQAHLLGDLTASQEHELVGVPSPIAGGLLQVQHKGGVVGTVGQGELPSELPPLNVVKASGDVGGVVDPPPASVVVVVAVVVGLVAVTVVVVVVVVVCAVLVFAVVVGVVSSVVVLVLLRLLLKLVLLPLSSLILLLLLLLLLLWLQ